MSAGQPNWQKLHEQGKLPKSAHGKIPMLAELEKSKEKLDYVEKECCDECRTKFFSDQPNKDQSPAATVKCEEVGCEYVAKGKSEGVAQNALRLHARSHVPKE